LNISLPHSLVVPSSTSRNLHKRSKKLCTHKELYVNVYSSSIHNSPQLEATQMPMNFKMWCIHIIKCYSAIKKEQNTGTFYSMDEPQKHYPKWKKPHKNTNLYNIWFHLYEMSRKGKFPETERRSMVACVRMLKQDWVQTREFFGVIEMVENWLVMVANSGNS